jgi:hypothetical protein
VATDGFRLLGQALEAASASTNSFLEMGVAYVRFAVDRRAHFEVMYRPELYRPADPGVLAARAAAARLLYGSDHPDTEAVAAGVAAWAIVHGLATLWLNGNLPEQLGSDPEQLTRVVAAHLRTPGGTDRPPNGD